MINNCSECRAQGTHLYDLTYTYDQGGNRKTKTDAMMNNETTYYYDVNYDVETWPEWLDYPDHRNNRLMGYELKTNLGTVLERVRYYYALEGAAAGNVYRIEREPVGADGQSSCITYNRAGEVWLVTQQHWPEGQPPENSVIDRLVEFRGRGRVRHIVRDRNLQEEGFPVDVATILGTEYDDQKSPMWDFTVAEGPVRTLTKAYGLGIAQTDPAKLNASYFHTDHLGTTRALTDDVGAVEATFAYTAFGERVDPGGFITRYAYVGSGGYEGFDGVPFLHVGARSYDSETGRFLERDPIGISGGYNVYAYVGLAPTLVVDPEGLIWPWAARGAVVGARYLWAGAKWGWSKVPSGLKQKATRRLAAAATKVKVLAMRCALKVGGWIVRRPVTAPIPRPITPPTPIRPIPRPIRPPRWIRPGPIDGSPGWPPPPSPN